MYIKATKTHVDKNGNPRCSYRLVRSDRVDHNIHQTTLLNLGVPFDTPKEQWPDLVFHIQCLLQRQPMLLADPALQRTAEDIVQRLQQKGVDTQAKPKARLRDWNTDSTVEVDLDSLKHPEHARQVGGERMGAQALKDLGLMEALTKAGVPSRDAILVTALVVARMLNPASERATHEWLISHSAILELLGWPAERTLSLTKRYRMNDLVYKHDATIQQALFKAERTLLSLPDTIVFFFDLTNTHYFGDAHGQYLAYGRSKQKRSDCPLVTLGLVLDCAGFPRTYEVLPGNVSEPATLKAAMKRLEATTEGYKPTVIMDAGIATEANIEWLKAQGYDWICVRRGPRQRPPQHEPDATLKTKAAHTVRAWQGHSSADESLVYVVSEAKQYRETEKVKQRRKRFEEALQALHEGLTKPYCTKRYDKVVERVGRIKEKHDLVAYHYDVTVVKGQTPNAKAVQCKRKERREDDDEALGAYVLRTSHTDWSLEKLITTYWRLSEIEATFRSLKSELGLRPLYHFEDHRIAAPISLSVYAYHAVHLIRTRLINQGIHLSWSTLRQKLSKWYRIKTTLQDTAGRLIVNIQDEEPDDELKHIARICGVTPGINRERYMCTPA